MAAGFEGGTLMAQFWNRRARDVDTERNEIWAEVIHEALLRSMIR